MTDTARVLVLGANGRMGSTVRAAVDADADLRLVAAVDPGGTPAPSATAVQAVQAVPSLDDVDPAGVDVAVDFTVADATRANAAWCARHGVHAVIGTTGLDDADVAAFRAAFDSSNCLIAPNFAVGAVLMMRFAELAAPHFGSAEVIELHHDAKVDAPSGTALRTLERMAAASSQWNADPTETTLVPGARGGRGPGGIPVHSVRLRGLVAHQQVLLGADGETLTIRHDTTDRSSFMGGVLLACKVIGDHPGVTVGLDSYLGL
ncbi:MAG TPA: 4-hydroxy-tetrahydrodipicolinate reductase [Acidimicrobiaceae bacterium]|nr:4-hydroxy-tetrahydrodipicolinate reductase [Acidimicrobiaceae bacterium]